MNEQVDEQVVSLREELVRLRAELQLSRFIIAELTDRAEEAEARIEAIKQACVSLFRVRPAPNEDDDAD